MTRAKTILGDCIDILPQLKERADLVYLDPPFFTGKNHKLETHDGCNLFEFEDLWKDHKEYVGYMSDRLDRCHSILSDTGSLFIHCDRNSSHLLRMICDQIFGEMNFRSEIIWHYRRWSNSAKTLLPAHQNILYYVKSKKYKFYRQYVDYSESTNVDQILQKRSRDDRNKSVYARDENGQIVSADEKKGVPLSDVWDIPYLNPKARERVGYPTQKPVMLLERIIELTTDAGDLVVDPFCGSGTTLVAAELLDRRSIGIDRSRDAVKVTKDRLRNPSRTDSHLMKRGRESYVTTDDRLKFILANIGHARISRNSGIDAILNQKIGDRFIFFRIQKPDESPEVGLEKLKKASMKRGGGYLVYVVTKGELPPCASNDKGLLVLNSDETKLQNWISSSLASNSHHESLIVSRNFH